MSRLRALAALLLAGAASVAAADPIPESGFGLPRDASADGRHIDELLHFTLGSTGLVFAVVLAVMLYAIARHRQGVQPARYSHGTRGSRRFLMGGVAAVALIVDGTLFANTELDLARHFWNYDAAEQDPQAVRIEVNAHQWSWAIRYPGPDGKFNTADDLVLTDEMKVPAGAPVILQLASTDVIHSFYLPNMRVKQDAVPGSVSRLLFTPTVPGEYDIGCAQHCGPNHYKMRGVLTVLSPEAYRQWLKTATADAARAYDPDDADAHWGWDWRRF